MAIINLTVNGEKKTIEVDPEMPLLWAIRENLGLTGTKFGCGIAQCGSCTVRIDGESVRSCTYPLSAAEGKSIVTIEGLSEDNDHPVQQAWIEEQVPQCGYCQSGQIMNAAIFLEKNPHPTDEEIDQAMSGILCRCGCYTRIKKAVKRASLS